MAKKNNKGFTLIEGLIVSTVVLSTLVFLYIQFVNINNNYQVSFTYNTVPGLYIARNISDYMLETNYQTVTSEISNGYLNITNNYTGSGALYDDIINVSDIKSIFLTNENPSDFQNYLKNNTVSGVDTNFKNFILKIPAKSDANLTRYRLIIEYNDNTYATIILSGNANE